MHLLRFLGLVYIGTALLATSAEAQTITSGTWTGTTAGHATWDTTTSANWTTGKIPVAVTGTAGIQAVFPGGTGIETTVPVISSGVSAAGLNFLSTSPAYTFNGGPITLDVGLVQNSSKAIITDSATTQETFNGMVNLTDANLVAATGTVATTYSLVGAAAGGSAFTFNDGLTLGNYVQLGVTTGTTTVTLGGPFVNNNVFTTPNLTFTGTATVLNWNASSMTSATASYFIKNLSVGSVTNITTDPTAAVIFGGSSAVGGTFIVKTTGLDVNSQLNEAGTATGTAVLEVNTGSAGAVTWAGTVALPRAADLFQFNVANANNALALTVPITTGTSTAVVQLTGPGTVVMDGVNTYAAASTTVQSGTLVMQAGTSSAAAFGLGGSTGAVVVNSGAGLEFANTVTTGTSNLNIANLTVTGGAGTTLGGSIGSTATGDAIKVTGTATVTGSSLGINIFGVSGVNPATGTYTLISGGAGSTLSGATTTAINNVYNASNFTIGALNVSSGSITVGVTAQTAQTAEYWVGGYSGGNSVWSISNGTTTSNWSTSPSSNVATSLTPGAGTTIFFNGLNTFNNAASTTLGSDMHIAGIVVGDSAGVGLIGDGHTLTIGAGGITVNAGSGSVTLSSMISNGGANEAWTNNSSNVLTIGAETTIASAATLTINGAGGVNFNGVTINGELTLNPGAGPVTINGDVMTNNFEFELTNNSSSLVTVNGQVEMGTTATGGFLDSDGTGNAVVNGPISGSNTGNAFGAGVLQTGTGTLTLSANTANVYLGSTIVEAGELDLGDTGGVAIPHALTIGVDAGSPSEVKLLASNQIATTSTVTIHSDGTLALNGFNNTVASLTSFAGTITGSGTLTSTAAPVFSGEDFTTNTIGSGATVASTAQASLATGDSLVVNGTLADAAGLTMASGTLTSLSGSGSISGPVIMNAGGNSISSTSTLTTGGITVNGTGNSLTSGTVSAGAAGTALNGSGTVALNVSGTLGGSGGVTIGTGSNAATLTLNTGGGISGPVSVTNGSTLAVVGATSNSLAGSLSLAGGSVVTLQNGAVNTLDPTSLTLSGNSTLDLDLGSGAADQLVFSSTNAFNSNKLTINVDALSGATTGSFTLLSGFTGGTLVLGDFTLGTVNTSADPSLASDTFSIGISPDGNTAYLLVSGAGSPATAYWKGGVNGSWAASSGANFVDGVASTNTLTSTPGSSTDVFFSANGSSHLNTTLDGSYEIHSLNFGSGTNAATAVTIAQGTSGTLTIDGGGINAATGAGPATISAPVALGASQSWTESGTTSVTVSGVVSDGGHNFTLTKAGSGTLTLTNANTYGGGTTVSAGALLLGNGSNGSATGTGTLNVNTGAVLGGSGTGLTGTSRTSSFLVNGTVVVGNGSDTTSSLALVATGAGDVNGVNGKIVNATLSFNLATNSSNANVLNLGATSVNFSNTQLALNLVGSNIVAADSSYVLITDSAGFNSATDGLTLQLINGKEVITGGLSIAPNTFFGTPSGGITTGFYNGSFLYVDGDNIDVEVVPEPKTWALMLGGLAMLILIVRRRNKNA